MLGKRTIIITGASQGIGAGLTHAFLERGYNVVANSRTISSSGRFVASERLALVDGNIGDAAVAAKIVETAISRFSCIDALVNNAASSSPSPLSTTRQKTSRCFRL